MTRALKLLAKTLLGLLLLAVVAVAGFITWAVIGDLPRKPLPSPDEFRARLTGPGVCPRNVEGNRIYVPLAEIPTIIRDVFLLIHERHFYQRSPYKAGVELPRELITLAIWGVSSRRRPGPTLSIDLARCFYADFCGHRVNLASTCFMTLLHRIERDLPKDLIFKIYLNEIYFGGQAFGVAAAAQALFNKPLAELTIDEAAFLAALPHGPNNYVGKRIEKGRERRNWIIGELAIAGTITPEEAAAAKERPLILYEPSSPWPR
jgi:penicillin-binding protein 1A